MIFREKDLSVNKFMLMFTNKYSKRQENWQLLLHCVTSVKFIVIALPLCRRYFCFLDTWILVWAPNLFSILNLDYDEAVLALELWGKLKGVHEICKSATKYLGSHKQCNKLQRLYQIYSACLAHWKLENTLVMQKKLTVIKIG